jgi:hypothetical protein
MRIVHPSFVKTTALIRRELDLLRGHETRRWWAELSALSPRRMIRARRLIDMVANEHYSCITP